MKVFPHNFDPSSNSGPNKFTRTLFTSLINQGQIDVVDNQIVADIEFCLIQQAAHKIKPMVLRLDGIWFNSEQDFKKQNLPIQFAYSNADAVIFQSQFNKKLTEQWFGKHKKSYVIHNAADEKLINRIDKKFWNQKLGNPREVWSCASSWRPHKRLKDNISYFLKFAPQDAVLAIAGKGASIDNLKVDSKRIFFLGELDYLSLLSLYKISSTFIHLAYLDHCPNVVVDAQAAGCHIVCSSTGGTSEIVNNGTILVEKEWDYSPIELYKPPEVDFYSFVKKETSFTNEFEKCTEAYYNVFKEVF